MKKQALGYLGFYFCNEIIGTAGKKIKISSWALRKSKVNNMRYEDSMKKVKADQIIKEQRRASKIKNNPERIPLA